MLKLQLPFRLTLKTPASFFRSNHTAVRWEDGVILEGLSISIRVGLRTYEVSSDCSLDESLDASRGTAWRRWRWQLDDGISIEQQMIVSAKGDALSLPVRGQSDL
jgi:hypothetical protein